MPSHYGPVESTEVVQYERFFLAEDFVAGTGYGWALQGVQLVLWAICVQYLWSRRGQGRGTRLMLGFVCILLAIETLFCIAQARTIELMYIDNRNYPGGPWQYFLDTQYLPIDIMFCSSLFSVTLVCDLLMLWRCWIVWTAAGSTIACLVTAVPCTMVLASFVMGILWIVHSSQPGLSLYSSLPRAFGTAYFAISLSTNIVMTALIVSRLVAYRRKHLAYLSSEHTQHYLSIATLVIESAALYSAFAVTFLVSYALDAPINQVWLAFGQAAQQVATYLIIYRVANGRAWTRTTMDTAIVSTHINFMNPVICRERNADTGRVSSDISLTVPQAAVCKTC